LRQAFVFYPDTGGLNFNHLDNAHSRVPPASPVNLAMALCETYADLKATLPKGRTVPDNDLWIAATAIRHSIPLVSHNRKHYDDIPDLVLLSETPKPLEPQMRIEEAGA
jgi:hypothetical protein